MHNTSFSSRDPTDIEQRFERLRGYALFPRGARKNVTHLSTKQIVHGVLSMATPRPGFAAVVSDVLYRLKPVGGAKISFGGYGTFGDEVVSILDGSSDAKSILEVRLSDSEIYNGSHCRASIEYRSENLTKTAYYVSSNAASLLRDGAEQTYNPRSLMSSVLEELVILPRFFRRLIEELRYEELAGIKNFVLPTPREDDDEESAKLERAKALGLSPSSQFLNLGVDGQIGWPRSETAVEVNGHRVVLLPATRDHATSIHIDLHRNRMSMEDAHTFLGRFLSVLTWCEDQPAVLQDGWSGNPQPVAVDRVRMGNPDWVPFGRRIPDNPTIRIALALYRQGRNAEESFLISYAVLSYYKIIELSGNKGTAKNWLRDNYEALKGSPSYGAEVAAFEEISGRERPHEYLFKYCRTAVAHAIGKYKLSDPDDTHELHRLHVSAGMLRLFARRYISNELGVSDSRIGLD